MSLKAMICPQCGSKLEFDDSQEYGVCKYCNTKVKIKDIFEVRHVMDNTEAVNNRKIMGDRCYRVGRFVQADNYYTQVLEDNPNDIESLYRKAICSVMIFIDKCNDVDEYNLYMSEAKKVIAKLDSKEEVDKFLNIIDEENVSMADMIIEKYKCSDRKFEDISECQEKERGFCKLLFYTGAILKHINDENRALDIYIKLKEVITYTSIFEMMYINDHSGRKDNSYKYYIVSAELTELYKRYVAGFINDFNASKARLDRISKLNAEKEEYVKELDLMRMHVRDMKKSRRGNSKFPLASIKCWLISLAMWIPTVLAVVVFLGLFLLAMILEIMGGAFVDVTTTILAIDVLLMPILLILSLVAFVIVWVVAFIFYASKKDDGIINMDLDKAESKQAIKDKESEIIEYEKTIRDIDATLRILEIWAK